MRPLRLPRDISQSSPTYLPLQDRQELYWTGLMDQMLSLPFTHPPCGNTDARPTRRYYREMSNNMPRLTPVSCMDGQPTAWPSSRRPRQTMSRSHDLTIRSNDKQPPRNIQQHSSPLPQAEWTPTPTMTSNPDQRPSSQGGHVVANFSRPVPSPVSPLGSRWDQPVRADLRRRLESSRQRARSSSNQSGEQFIATDASLLYPNTDPYAWDRLSINSAPDELEHTHTHTIDFRSEPTFTIDSPEYVDPDSIPAISPSTSLTYPPIMRRAHTTTAATRDATFADDEEFNLFAQATTGLGMDEPFGLSASSFAPSFSSRPPDKAAAEWQQEQHHTNRPYDPRGSAPIITQAIQQLENLLEDFSPSPRSRATPSTRAATHTLTNPQGHVHGYHSQPSLSPLGRRPSSPWRASSAINDVSPLEDEQEQAPPYQSVDDVNFDDEEEEAQERDLDDEFLAHELPDYAQSQAEMQTLRRVEAARRAQELQRRWQLGGSRRPIQ